MYRATSIMFIFIAVVCACLAAADIGLVLSPEKRLIRELIREYKKQGVVGRPVTDSKQVTYSNSHVNPGWTQGWWADQSLTANR